MKKNLVLLIPSTTISSLFVITSPFCFVSSCSQINKKIMLTNGQNKYQIDTTLANSSTGNNPFNLGNLTSLAYVRQMLVLDNHHHFKNLDVNNFVKSLFTNIPQKYFFKIVSEKFSNGNYLVCIKLSEKNNPVNNNSVTLQLCKLTNLNDEIITLKWKDGELQPNLFGSSPPKDLESLLQLFTKEQLPPQVSSFLVERVLPKLENNNTYTFTHSTDCNNFVSDVNENEHFCRIRIEVKTSQSIYNCASLVLCFENIPHFPLPVTPKKDKQIMINNQSFVSPQPVNKTSPQPKLEVFHQSLPQLVNSPDLTILPPLSSKSVSVPNRVCELPQQQKIISKSTSDLNPGNPHSSKFSSAVRGIRKFFRSLKKKNDEKSSFFCKVKTKEKQQNQKNKIEADKNLNYIQ